MPQPVGPELDGMLLRPKSTPCKYDSLTPPFPDETGTASTLAAERPQAEIAARPLL